MGIKHHSLHFVVIDFSLKNDNKKSKQYHMTDIHYFICNILI